MLKKASEVIASGNVQFVVDYAIELNREISASEDQLQEAKAHLRQVASERKGSGRVEIDGHLGVATVAFSKDSVKSVKGSDPKDLEDNLSAATFARLFTKKTVVVPVPNLQDQLETLTEAERTIVSRYFEVVPNTPKVYLTE